MSAPSLPGDVTAPRWHLALIVLAPILVYANSLHVPFVFDDDTSIVINPGISTWTVDPVHEPASRRLAYLTFKLNYLLGGFDPFGYHVFNIAIHVLSSLVVYGIARRLLRLAGGSTEPGATRIDSAALVGALFFALHPVQTQAVTYVVQRIASLATLFYALSMWLYVESRVASAQRSRMLLGGALTAAAAAMLTKEIAFTLPFAIMLVDVAFLPGTRRRRIATVAALLLLLSVIPLAFASRGLSVTNTSLAGSDASRLEYASTQAGVVVRYIGLVLWPAGQNLDHDVPLEHGFGLASVLASLALLATLAGALASMLPRSRSAGVRVAGAGGLLFFLGLSVESSLVPIADVMFEHRLYLPMVGGALAVSGASLAIAHALPTARRWAAAAACAWLLALGVATVARNNVWRSALSIWSDAASKSPRKARPHYNVGEALRAAGDLDGARREWAIAVELDPLHSYAANQLGSYELVHGNLEAAERWYRSAIAGRPVNPEAFYNLALVLESSGRPGDAVEFFRRFVEAAPPHLSGVSGPLRARFGWR